MSSIKKIHSFAASVGLIAVMFATTHPSLAQNAPQRALDTPGGAQEDCHVRPDGQADPAQPLTERLQDCNSVLKPKGLGDPDIVTPPPKVNDPIAIEPPKPTAPASP
ncbi:hypothetical protein [Rhizobium sp. FKL33]|uniref:hypothetical protein n=1 Tax=Rhizobium sp. FKL33 TaxID=2562307 RepID=UPI0010C140C6|nr:hypothetical protein [Rhizobium sp. FKL33]